MGTNYYLHLGKTSSQGEGKPLLFIAATDVEHLDANAGRLGWVMNEYGNEVPWSDFIERYRAADVDLTAIGELFS
jgi:hypothetical protein